MAFNYGGYQWSSAAPYRGLEHPIDSDIYILSTQTNHYYGEQSNPGTEAPGTASPTTDLSGGHEKVDPVEEVGQ